MHIETEMQILLVLHFTVRLSSTESHGPQKFNILLKLDGERYVCFVAYYKRGNSRCQAKGEGKGKGKRAEKVTRGGGVTTWRKHGRCDPSVAGVGGSCSPCSPEPPHQRRRAGCGIWPSVKKEMTVVALIIPAVTVTHKTLASPCSVTESFSLGNWA